RVTIPYSGGLSFSLYHWSPLIAYRLKRLRAKMDILMNAPEVEARKTIFKAVPESTFVDKSSSLR
ncbi:unnamed protein product, partial [Rotaria magnacalcarata]